MATWAQEQPSGTTTRRKWKVEDRETLNNLKYQIASDGCSEVQYDLARQLLNKPAVEDDGAKQAIQAIHWLLRAAQQGHEDAKKLLRQCYDDGIGVTEENCAEIQTCLSMTSGERAARNAARELFNCLANGTGHITPRQLEHKMRKIYNLQKKRHRRGGTNKQQSDSNTDSEVEIEGIAENGSNGPKNGLSKSRRHHNRTAHSDRLITEENLVSAAANYAAGQMPAVNDELSLSVPHPASLDHVPHFYRLFLHPIVFITLLYHRVIDFVSKLPGSVPTNIRWFLLVGSYSLTVNEGTAMLVPTVLYYLCILVMIWSSCKMLKSKHDFVDFRIWSGLFLNYGDRNIEVDLSENRFLKNNMKPYLYFFCAFVANLILYPTVLDDYLLHSELTIISCLMVFTTLMSFMYSSKHRLPDWTILISFGVNVLAKYPYELDDVVNTSWRFLDLKVPTFCSFLIGNGIEFCLSCRTALYLLIPGFLFQLARRIKWHGTYTYLIPHCVTLSWLQLCIMTSRSATMFGVVRATLGLAGFLLFLPLFGIVALLVPVFVAIEWIGFADPDVRVGTIGMALVLILLTIYFGILKTRTQKWLKSLQILICLVALVVLTFPFMTSSFKDPSRILQYLDEKDIGVLSDDPVTDMPESQLSWHRYYTICGQPAWENNNRIKAQIRCSQLEDIPVIWEGTVSQIQLSRFSNTFSTFVNAYMPRWLSNLIHCLYGDRIGPCNNDELDPYCAEIQNMIKHKRCSLHRWNKYEYEVSVKMQTGLLSKNADVLLHADHKFGNVTHRLVAGDRISFYGVLSSSGRLVTLQSSAQRTQGIVQDPAYVHVQLLAIKCISCQVKDLPPISIRSIKQSHVDARLRDLIRGIKYLLNVLLNPLITFK